MSEPMSPEEFRRQRDQMLEQWGIDEREFTRLWLLLERALKRTKLPTSSGELRSVPADEFMLMNVGPDYAEFKHRVTRRYAHLARHHIQWTAYDYDLARPVVNALDEGGLAIARGATFDGYPEELG